MNNSIDGKSTQRVKRGHLKGGITTVTTALLLVVVCVAALAGAADIGDVAIRPIDPVEAKSISYVRDIHPLFVDKCGACHGVTDASSGLTLTTIAGIRKGGKRGLVLIARNPDDSPLVAYIRGLRTPRMPMGGDPLSVDDLHLIREWISAGAIDDTASLTTGPGVAAVAAPNVPIEDESALTLQQLRAKHLSRMPVAPPPPHAQYPANNEIDQFIAAQWAAKKLAPPPVCDDYAFIRRVTLDVTGRIPTGVNVQAFVADKSPTKRRLLVDTLLADNDDYAVAWTPFWEDALASNGMAQGGSGSRPNLRPWLIANLTENRPYDEMVAELIDPTTSTPTASLAKGWVRNGDDVETAQTAAYTAQVFLGTEVKCASCHNHFLNPEWSQKKFVAFASYFAPKDLEVIRCEHHEGEFMTPSFLFKTPAAQSPTAAPVDLNGRLHEVSRLLVDPENPRFAPCIVNRLWKRCFGLGLVEPADDFRADGRAPSNPALLAWLSDDFMRHGYDLKHTLRLILNSRTYQLSYDPKLSDHFDLSHPEAPRYYRSPGLRRLTAEQLFDSINIAVGNSSAPRAYLDYNSTPLSRALGRPAARNDISTARPDDVAVVQALELLNGEEFSSRVHAGTLGAQLATDPSRVDIVERAYWATLGRPPTRPEAAEGARFLYGWSDERTAVDDMLWALMVSPEFNYIR